MPLPERAGHRRRWLEDGAVAVEVVREDETSGASQPQVQELLGIDQSCGSLRRQVVFRDAEVDLESNLRDAGVVSG